MNFVTPKAGAEHELWFNKPASETNLLNKSSRLAPTLGVTEFLFFKSMILVTLYLATSVELRCLMHGHQKLVCWTKARP
jgi:hypothetical protein